MSRLITKTGIELPTFSPALGPESVKRKPKQFSTEPLKSSHPTNNHKSSNPTNNEKLSNNYLSEFNLDTSKQFNFDHFNQFFLSNNLPQFSSYEPTNFNYALDNGFEKSFGQNQKTEIPFQSFFNNFQFNFQF